MHSIIVLVMCGMGLAIIIELVRNNAKHIPDGLARRLPLFLMKKHPRFGAKSKSKQSGAE